MLVRHLGLVGAWLVGTALSVMAFVGAFGLSAGDSTGFMVVCALSGIGLGADLAVPAALLAGVVQKAPRAGQVEGVYFGWWNSASKLNLGLASGIALPLLAWAGYSPGSRTPEAIEALKLAYVLVPCVLKALAASFLWRWHTLQGHRE